MPISPRAFSQIVADLRDKVKTTAPALDTSEGTFYRISAIDPLSLELEELESLLLEVQASQSLLTAVGYDLDLLAFNYNVYRKGAQKASGFAQFFVPVSGFTDPITIPKGSTVLSSSGVPYETLLSGVLNGFSQQTERNGIDVYEITLPIGSTVSGGSGNAFPGSIISVNVTDVNVTNDGAIEGGYEQETDTSLSVRAIESFGIWSRGVKSAVEFGAKLVPGVYYASAVYAYAGHFFIYVSDQAGNLSDEMHDAVDVILTDWAASGVGWTVLQPPLVLIDTTIKVSFRSSANIQTQINQVKTDVATVINASTSSKIYLDDLHAAIRSKVSSYVSHFDLDTPNEHVLENEGTILRSGVVTVIDQTGTI